MANAPTRRSASSTAHRSSWPSWKARGRSIRSTGRSPAGRCRRSIKGHVYAINLKCDWVFVTNLKEIRLYHKGNDYAHYESFETAGLADDPALLKKFVFLLGADRVVRPDGSPIASGLPNPIQARQRQVGRIERNSGYPVSSLGGADSLSVRGELTLLEQILTMSNAIGMIDAKYFNRRSADGGLANENGATPPEMNLPFIQTRVE